MSSPARSRTPRGNRGVGVAAPQVIPETPRSPRPTDENTPRNASSEVTTPVRWASNRRNEQNPASSPPPTVVPTSPAAGKQNEYNS